ncbi:MAG TPA: hypothetical protein ENN09_04655 [Planctomycetes bacterium]|nr:hypothetical protein [Planctomycetota bacterium]
MQIVRLFGPKEEKGPERQKEVASGLLKKKKTWRNPGLARQFAFGELRACPSDLCFFNSPASPVQ